jgi:hypothetical protein
MNLLDSRADRHAILNIKSFSNSLKFLDKTRAAIQYPFPQTKRVLFAERNLKVHVEVADVVRSNSRQRGRVLECIREMQNYNMLLSVRMIGMQKHWRAVM